MKTMNFRALDFTLRVWLTSVLAAPAIYMIIQAYIDSNNNTSYPEYFNPIMYLIFVLFELVFSVIIWLVFWGVSEAIVFYCQTEEYSAG